MGMFVIGDIHGGYKALKQVIERSGFNPEQDTLVTIGDIVDGWGESYECVELLLSIPNRIDIQGNHDAVFLKWMIKGSHDFLWGQGAAATARSYARHSERENVYVEEINKIGITNLTVADIPKSHIDFFMNQKLYHLTENGILFVHGGINRHVSLEEQSEVVMLWDRDFFMAAMSDNIREKEAKKRYPFRLPEGINKVIIGHTTTEMFKKTKPIFCAGGRVINMDTGAGWSGKLSMMNVNTLEVYQSDVVKTLYPEEKGR